MRKTLFRVVKLLLPSSYVAIVSIEEFKYYVIRRVKASKRVKVTLMLFLFTCSPYYCKEKRARKKGAFAESSSVNC